MRDVHTKPKPGVRPPVKYPHGERHDIARLLRERHWSWYRLTRETGLAHQTTIKFSLGGDMQEHVYGRIADALGISIDLVARTNAPLPRTRNR